MPEFDLKSAQFRREREAAWKELEELLARLEKKGLESLTADELHRLPVLYRSAVSSLSVASAISLDKNLLDYLTALVGRAYVAVYGAKRRVGEAVADFFLARFPGAVRQCFAFVLAAYAILGLGVLTGYRMTLADPEHFYSLVDEGMAEGRSPTTTTDDLRKILYGGSDAPLGYFATSLFTHNAEI